MAVINTILNVAPWVIIASFLVAGLMGNSKSKILSTLSAIAALTFVVSVATYVGTYWILKIETMRAIIGM